MPRGRRSGIVVLHLVELPSTIRDLLEEKTQAHEYGGSCQFEVLESGI
jgi:hypothetical protein